MDRDERIRALQQEQFQLQLRLLEVQKELSQLQHWPYPWGYHSAARGGDLLPEKNFFNGNLKKLRKERDATQQEFAELLDVEPRHYRGLEKGQRPTKATTVAAAARALGVRPGSLVDYPEVVYQSEMRAISVFDDE